MAYSSHVLTLMFAACVGEALRLQPGRGPDPQVTKCSVTPHTYINIGDGGCFQFLQPDGEFQNSRAAAQYEEAFCPFVGNHERRMALMSWYYRSVDLGEPPLAVNDVAMSCLFDDIGTVFDQYGFRLGLVGWSNEELCETMLSLPLMFESIGFDGPGLIMEDMRTSTVWTFKGRKVADVNRGRAGPSEGCNSTFAEHLGPARHGRLALRALLPTYLRHRYAESSGGMILKGARALLSPLTVFSKKYWKDQVKEVCGAASNADTLQELFSFANLRAGKLVSRQAMDRDKGHCHEPTPCNYLPDPEQHVGACETCSDDFPWFSKETGSCWNAESFDREKCADPSAEKRTCDCHKAICWYFTKDFKAAMKVVAKVCQDI